MGFLTDWINEFLRGLLVDGVMGNLGGLFEGVNNQIGEIAAQVWGRLRLLGSWSFIRLSNI